MRSSVQAGTFWAPDQFISDDAAATVDSWMAGSSGGRWSATDLTQGSVYTLCPECHSLNDKRASKCYSCRADLRRATKVAVDARFGVVPVERYLTPEEIAERDAAEKVRRAAEAAARPRRSVGERMGAVIRAPFSLVGRLLNPVVNVARAGARGGGRAASASGRLLRAGSGAMVAAGASAGQKAASAGRTVGAALSGAALGVARVTGQAARSGWSTGQGAGRAIVAFSRRMAAGGKRRGAAATSAGANVARATARTSANVAQTTARTSAGVARTGWDASQAAGRSSLATGQRAAARAGAASASVGLMMRDQRLNTRGVLRLMLVAALVLVVGGLAASWLALSAAGGGSGATPNVVLAGVGVVAALVGVGWAAMVVRRLRRPDPEAGGSHRP